MDEVEVSIKANKIRGLSGLSENTQITRISEDLGYLEYLKISQDMNIWTVCDPNSLKWLMIQRAVHYIT